MEVAEVKVKDKQIDMLTLTFKDFNNLKSNFALLLQKTPAKKYVSGRAKFKT